MVAMRDIQAFSDEIARKFKPAQIILFGSHARGEAKRDSDVDLLVVMPYRGHSVYKEIEIRLAIDRCFPVDVLVRSPAEIRRRIELEDWFIRDIMEEGRVLYEAEDARVGRKSRSGLRKRRSRASRSEDA